MYLLFTIYQIHLAKHATQMIDNMQNKLCDGQPNSYGQTSSLIIVGMDAHNLYGSIIGIHTYIYR